MPRQSEKTIWLFTKDRANDRVIHIIPLRQCRSSHCDMPRFLISPWKYGLDLLIDFQDIIDRAFMGNHL